MPRAASSYGTRLYEPCDSEQSERRSGGGTPLAHKGQKRFRPQCCVRIGKYPRVHSRLVRQCLINLFYRQSAPTPATAHVLSLPGAFYARFSPIFYSVHLETQFFLPPVSPVSVPSTGLTGGGKRQNTKWRSKVNAMQKKTGKDLLLSRKIVNFAFAYG